MWVCNSISKDDEYMIFKPFHLFIFICLFMANTSSFSETDLVHEKDFNSLVLNSWKLSNEINTISTAKFINFKTQAHIVPERIYRPTENKYSIKLKRPETAPLPIEYIIYYSFQSAGDIQSIASHLRNSESIQEALSLDSVKYRH